MDGKLVETKEAVSPANNPNRELFKRFEVQKLLGKGSYGIVYRVKRLLDGRVYALKEIDVRKMSARTGADAVNEIRLLASVKHQNIIRYHEAFLDGNLLCIVMEYAQYGDLGRLIKKAIELKKAFPEKIIWKYFMQICEGMQVLHNAKIIHRDIKPMNIFVGDHDIVKVGDLGIAKMIKEGVANTQIGTPHYMPPELWQNKKYTFTSDLWALGCLLYELMTYRVPFEARSMAELHTKVMAGHFKPITPGKYSADLINLMGQLLQVNPQRRPMVSQILASSVLQKHAAGGSHIAAAAAPFSKGTVLQTIKIPADLQLLQARLPQAEYGDAEGQGEQIQARKSLI
ncbi:hypothetical protein ABBQ38_006461 [Trebouxia sp. C0009 RCD-2024]